LLFFEIGRKITLFRLISQLKTMFSAFYSHLMRRFAKKTVPLPFEIEKNG